MKPPKPIRSRVRHADAITSTSEVRQQGVLMSVDPGINGCGVAIFNASKLEVCAYVRNREREGTQHGPRESASMALAVAYWWFRQPYVSAPEVDIVVEYPQVYQRGANKTKGDPNVAVLPLVGIDCALAAIFPNTCFHAYQPHAWKHNLPKETDGGANVVDGRITDRLTDAELRAYRAGTGAAGSLAHNVIDAVGIGLFALGRFSPRRVYRRE